MSVRGSLVQLCFLVAFPSILFPFQPVPLFPFTARVNSLVNHVGNGSLNIRADLPHRGKQIARPAQERTVSMHVPTFPSEERPANAAGSPGSGAQPVLLPLQTAAEEETRYYELEPLESADTPFVAPFQPSQPLSLPASSSPQIDPAASVSAPPEHQQARKQQRLPLLTMVAILVCVGIVVGVFVVNAFAQNTPLQTGMRATPAGHPSRTTHQQAIGAHVASTQNSGQGQVTSSSADWLPQTLPDGWVNAGLSRSDAIEALRTALTFTDREMSLDYRRVGTPAQHGGTFTAALFLLTPAAQQRFFHNDVREINNTLFEQVNTSRLIRQVINPAPKLVAFAAQGQHQFAWVDVSFQLWQSQITEPAGQRQEGEEIDPATNRPRVHHMAILLLRVAPAAQGVDAPMGGTGWLVSTYALDLPGGTLPGIVQPA